METKTSANAQFNTWAAHVKGGSIYGIRRTLLPNLIVKELTALFKNTRVWSSNAAFTIAFFAAVNHNYDHKQRTLKQRNLQNGSKPTDHKSQTMTFWALSIQQKFGLKFRKFHVPNGTVNSGCTDPTQATARFVIVLASRIQKSGTGGNNFVKWKGKLRSHRPKWPDRSKRTTFKADPKYSGRTKPKWSVPFDVATEITGTWVEWKAPFETVEVNFCFLRGPLRWLTAAKNANVSRLLKFRVLVFLKSAVKEHLKKQWLEFTPLWNLLCSITIT